MVTITVYLTDPRLIDPLMPIRREFFPEGRLRRPARPSQYIATGTTSGSTIAGQRVTLDAFTDMPRSC